MDYDFKISAISVPPLANKPLIVITTAAGGPAQFIRLATGFRASSSAWEGFVIRKVVTPEEGGDPVNASAHDGDWTIVPNTTVTVGPFDTDPVLAEEGAAGAEHGSFTMNAVGYLPYEPGGSYHRIPAGTSWAICTPSGAPGAQTADILITIRE
jgi:hypothetical protein